MPKTEENNYKESIDNHLDRRQLLSSILESKLYQSEERFHLNEDKGSLIADIPNGLDYGDMDDMDDKNLLESLEKRFQ